MNNFICDYKEYRKILRNIKESEKYCDYEIAKNLNEFVVLRHDIEFSIERAFQLSQIENEEQITSSYFVQLTNNSYNAFSKKNLDMLRQMIHAGHHIGLHYHCNGNTNQNDVKNGINKELKILETMLNHRIDRFSMHRPSKDSRYWEISIPGIINTYGKDFFTYSEDPLNENISVKYLADSKHRWNYGYPDQHTLKNNDKVQILIHPFSWTNKGYSNENNFKSLINDKVNGLMETFENEFQRYSECKDIIRSDFKEFNLD